MSDSLQKDNRIQQKVFETLSAVMEISPSEVKLESSSDSIENWDSLSQMNLVMTLEEEFDTRFTDEQIVTMNDVKTIIQCLQRNL